MDGWIGRGVDGRMTGKLWTDSAEIVHNSIEYHRGPTWKHKCCRYELSVFPLDVLYFILQLSLFLPSLVSLSPRISKPFFSSYKPFSVCSCSVQINQFLLHLWSLLLQFVFQPLCYSGSFYTTTLSQHWTELLILKWGFSRAPIDRLCYCLQQSERIRQEWWHNQTVTGSPKQHVQTTLGESWLDEKMDCL